MFHPFFLLFLKEPERAAYSHTSKIYGSMDSAERDFNRIIHEIPMTTMVSLIHFVPRQAPETVFEAHGLMEING